MKRFLSVMLIAVIAVSSVFAMSGYIGASSGYSTHYDKIADELQETATFSPVNVDGATFFGKGSFNIGLSYGAEIVSIPWTVGSGNLSTDCKPSDFKWTLAPYAGLAFQYKFNDNFALAGSVNATYNWDKVSKTVLGNEVKGAYHELGLMGNVYVNTNFGPFNVRTGLLMSGPIGSWITGSALGANASTDMLDMKGPFNVALFAGIGFAY